MEREINQHIQGVITFCQEHDIVLVMGNVEDVKQTQIKWVGRNPSSGVWDWQEYLQTALKMGIKTIILEKHLCAPTELFEEVMPFFEEIEDKYVKKQFEQAMQEYGAFENEIMVYQLYFFKDDLCFRYKEAADDIRPKAEALLNIIDTAKEISEIEEGYHLDELEESRKQLEHQMEEDAIYLAANEGFQRAKTYDQKLHIAQQLLAKDTPTDEIEETMGLDSYWRKLIRKATTLYEVEIRPKKEEELASKIQELKAQGFSKKEIADKLKISLYLVNKWV